MRYRLLFPYGEQGQYPETASRVRMYEHCLCTTLFTTNVELTSFIVTIQIGG